MACLLCFLYYKGKYKMANKKECEHEKECINYPLRCCQCTFKFTSEFEKEILQGNEQWMNL